MPNITLSITNDMKKKMDQMEEVNWSGLVRKLIEQEISRRLIREEMLRELKKEEPLNKWAVELIRKGRKNENSA